MRKSGKAEPIASLPPEAAFVVQFRSDAATEAGRFAGRVEHIVSGRATRFTSLRELKAFIVRALDACAESRPIDREERDA